MPCAECENTVCTCGGLCFCCPNACLCTECFHVRLDQPEQCPSVGGGRCSHSSKSDLETQHQSSSRTPDERSNTGSVAEATQGTSMASPEYVSEMSCCSVPTISPTFDDYMIFQMDMDDIDFPPRNPAYAEMASIEAEKRLLHEEYLFKYRSTSAGKIKKSQVTRISPLRTDSVTAIKDLDGLKLRESRREVPITSQGVDECLRNNPHADFSEIEESRVTRVSPSYTCAATDLDQTKKLEKEMEASTHGVPGCSKCNLNETSSKLEESQVADAEHKFNASSLKWTESPESEMMISKNIPGCSHKCTSKQEESLITDSASETVSSSADEYASDSLPSVPSSSSSVRLRSPPSSCFVSEMIPQDIPGCSHKCISKQEESQIIDSSSEAVSSSADEYASESLPSIPSSSSSVRLRSPPSSFSASPQSPPLSASAPSIYDLPQFAEFKSSEQKQSATLGTSKESLTSDLSKSETLISDSHPIDKSRTSSESSSSIEVIPEDIPNVEQSDIPSNSAASSQVDNRIIQAESTQPGTFEMLSNSL